MMPPGLGGGVDNRQQACVDLVAVRQELVEVHRAHDGAHVDHHKVQESELKIGDFVGSAAHVEQLEEGDAIDGDCCVVLGDDFLPRHVDDLLHHVELVADRVDVGKDEAEADVKQS